MTAHPELERCLQPLVDLADRQDRSWSEVLDRALQAKIAINQVLGAGNIYSREINRILCDLCLWDRASIDAAAVLRLVDWVRAAIRAHDSCFGKMLCDWAGPRPQYANN